ncbi:MAG TPA: hypothetical protein VJ201_08995 [Candidatus Babeliales bacterium]|nr:hypothetical protein [Candidatus Babeliales bacterium]
MDYTEVVNKLRSILSNFALAPWESNTFATAENAVSTWLASLIESGDIKDCAVVCDETNNKINSELRVDVCIKWTEKAEFVFIPVVLTAIPVLLN